MKSKINKKNIIAYIQGNFRYSLYYSKVWSFLIPSHIHEQIIFRINSMNKQCYAQGSCVKCGCETTQLQMANKACAGNCYPKMLSRKQWKLFKKNKYFYIDKVIWIADNNIFKKYNYEHSLEKQ